MKQKPVQESKLNIQLRPASIEEAGLFYSQMEEGEDQTLGIQSITTTWRRLFLNPHLHKKIPKSAEE